MAGTVKKLQFSEGTDVGAPTDLGIATSTVVISAYANDAAYVTANGAAISGSVYLNTTTNKFRMYTNGSWRNVVPESDSADPTKLFLVDVTGNSTGVTATLDFNATANRTYTFPDVTDSLVPQTNPTLRGVVTLQNLSGDQPAVRLSEDPDNGTNYIEHKAADSMAGNYTVKWPAAQASAGQVLQNDGSGNLSWSTTAAGNQTANIRASEGAGTTTLTNSDARIQVFNLSAARTVQLPTTSVVAGDVWEMINPNAFILTVQSSGANTIVESWRSRVSLVAKVNTPTTASDWDVLSYSPIVKNAVLTQAGSSTGAGSSGTFKTVASLSLDAGQWDVSGIIYTSGGSNVTQIGAAISLVTNSTDLGTGEAQNLSILSSGSWGNNASVGTPIRAVEFTTTTTVYLVGFSVFSSAPTYTTDSYLRARRIY